MSRGRSTASITASPVLVGAVTVLLTVIAVFIAYNANAGLPFVPTYDVKAELPSGGKLVRGNEVRLGGFRIGVVEEISPIAVVEDGRRSARALVDLKLDKIVQPLAADTLLRVRPRSALGLKYVEVTPGRSQDKLAPGDTIPLANASEPREIEDLLATFDRDTRPNIRTATEGFGDAFTGRGPNINVAIQELNPFFASLRPVMDNLADPATDLDSFFRQIGRASAQVAPVAEVQGRLFGKMADTFAAIGSDPAALQQTIEKSPPTLDTAIRSFRVQRPFLTDFIDLSERLRPAAQELPRSLPALNRAFRVGTPILPRTVELNEDLITSSTALQSLFENPRTLQGLEAIDQALTVTQPLVEFVNPYQSVCNYAVYWLHPLGEHMSSTVGGPFGGGTAQGQGVKNANAEQPNSFMSTDAPRPADVPPLGPRPMGWNDAPARGAEFNDEPASRLFGTPYPPAVDAQGNADCQIGQTGYPNGPLTEPWTRYGPGYVPNPDGSNSDIPTGGSFSVAISDYPVLTGGTYKSRELGIDNLRDVP